VTKLIPLHNRKGEVVANAIIDDEDFERVSQYSWFLIPKGYVVSHHRGGKRRLLYLHRFVYPSSAKHVDHRDRNKLNCQKDNLRPANGTQNAANAGIRRDNTSGYKGVCWHKQRQKWNAQINVNGARKYLGLYDTPIEAAKAYDEKAKEVFGEFAYLNFE
jgi:hypothetical protein